MPNFEIKEVQSFWDANPCGLPKMNRQADKAAFFRCIETDRYTKQPKILSYANCSSFKNKRVLEVGCGIGTDAIQFAKAGALYTGVDLTAMAIKVAKERFEISSQNGDFAQIDAENLPFPDNYFDHVYSFGVIHHSPNPKKIVSQIYRVLKPGGTITVMLYNRTSFYYVLEVRFIRRLFFAVCDKKGLCNLMFSFFGTRIKKRLESYRNKLEQIKCINKNPTAEEWISMNTDDVFCPIARVYSEIEARKLFYLFSEFHSEVWFIDKDSWFLWLIFGRFMPRVIESWLERKFGWFRMIEGKK